MYRTQNSFIFYSVKEKTGIKYLINIFVEKFKVAVRSKCVLIGDKITWRIFLKR